MAIPAKNLSLGTNGEDYLVDYLNKNYLTKYKLKKVEKNPSNLLKNNHQQGDIFITCEDDAVIKVEVKSGYSKSGTSYTVSSVNKTIDQYLKKLKQLIFSIMQTRKLMMIKKTNGTLVMLQF